MSAKDRHISGRVAANSNIALLTSLKNALHKQNIQATNHEIRAFIDWYTVKQWQDFQDYYMEQEKIAMRDMDSTPILIENGTKGKPYKSRSIVLPPKAAADFVVEGLEGTGLEVDYNPEENSFTIQGTPKQTGDFILKIKYKFEGWIKGKPILERDICFVINPDPRSLWRDIPSSENIPYHKPDIDCGYVKIEADSDGTPGKDIVAASRRGRSHAQDGRARDDHFQLHHCKESDWYIIAVADGAGSAKFSRKGSELACSTVVQRCEEVLHDNPEFEAAIKIYHDTTNDIEAEQKARKGVGDHVYNILVKAAYAAYKEISKAADEAAKSFEGVKTKDFATTLLLAICKKFDFGWFVASFWVGDGAIALYERDKHTVTILGVPDEGEFAGQTRFLTMKEIFNDSSSLYQRIRFNIKDDFTALMLMTDGVSDPMFGSDANLNDIDKWDELWDKIHHGFPEDDIAGVDMTDDNEASKEQLLNWLNFWVPGEHDDRTIAILH